MRERVFHIGSSKTVCICILLAICTFAIVRAESVEERYKRAEQFSFGNVQKMVFKTGVSPKWIEKSDRFWYLNNTAEGKEFVFVDPSKNTRRPAFDHEKLAAALNKAADKDFKAENLPFNDIEYIDGEKSIRFKIGSKLWTCGLKKYVCTSEKVEKELPPNHLVSPDGRRAVFSKDYNLYVKALPDGEATALTTDGEEYYDYGQPPSFIGKFSSAAQLKASPPLALWSPDSKKLVTHRLDVRKVKDLNLLKFSPPGKDKRPRLYTYKYPMAGDKDVGLAQMIVFNVEKGTSIAFDAPPELITYMTPLEKKHVWWSEDSSSVYFIRSERGDKTKILCEADSATGMTREILEERGDTHVELNLMIGMPPNVRILSGGDEIIWYSQRDGWAHLYLYDGKTRKLKNRITQGEWVVRDILNVDEKDRWVYFTASGKEDGRDPYFRHLYRAKLDGSNLQLLTPEDADHEITAIEMAGTLKMSVHFSPTGKYFTDTYSRMDLPPVTVLRSRDGKLIRKLEEADIGKLLEAGWKFPKPFKVKARDGKTDIYGLLIYPSDFDPAKKYPLIDGIYPGPQMTRTPKSFPTSLLGMMFWMDQSLAELGFVVANIDGMGTPLRSKAFHDFAYGNLGEAGGLKDHIEGFKQLAAEHPYIDLDRVGIYGSSGGGFATARALLEFPNFYKVGVSSAGNHDQRGYIAFWGEKYQGLPEGDNYLNQVTAGLAKNLKGKLFLVHGGMDDNVHPALTFQLVDALIKANKRFDLLIVPNATHGVAAHPYYTLREWDYFVEHLLGEKPPEDYKLGGKKEKPEQN
ncbi:MAG: DPP IV N-terminal domain-containing protein [Candidatus Aminicenantes bacterium]|nr:DPP IV N-terminal domain-containing protein [Candidatus Aminicenantes bacterium]